MPEFILPDEADQCPYCGGVLYDPPNCCLTAIAAWCEEYEAARDSVRIDPPDPPDDEEVGF